MKKINFNNLIKEYFLDFASIILLLASLVFLFFNVYYNPLLQYGKTITTLSNQYTKDELKYYKLLHKNDKKKTDSNTNTKEIKLDTIPALLVRINNTCVAPKVIIRTLIPNSNNPFRFELKFISNYLDFIRVLSEFEKLNITINTIDIRPYEIKQKEAKHIITLDVSAIEGGKTLSKEDISFLIKELSRKQKRDPFQRFAKIGKKIKRLVDLTWIHKLSGIGKMNGQYSATINRRPYLKGDTFNDMKITKISSNSVLLSKQTDNGTYNYILNFRTKIDQGKANEQQK